MDISQLFNFFYISTMETAEKGKVILPSKFEINVDLAQTISEKEIGLSARESIGDNEGMLFVFPETSLHRFWMNDTLIPLDMIWFDDDKTVIFIQSHVPPCLKDPCLTYGPPKESRYVLEVNAGFTAKHDIQVGDHVGWTNTK